MNSNIPQGWQCPVCGSERVCYKAETPNEHFVCFDCGYHSSDMRDATAAIVRQMFSADNVDNFLKDFDGE